VASTKKRSFAQAMSSNGGPSSNLHSTTSSDANGGAPSLADLVAGRRRGNVVKIDPKKFADAAVRVPQHTTLNHSPTNKAKKFHKKQVKRAAEEEEEMHEDTLKFKNMLSQVPGPEIKLINDFPDEPSLPVDFEFINELKLGAGVPQWDSAFTEGCSCPESGCSDHEHECSDLDIFEHKMFAYTKGGRIYSSRDNQLAIFECNSRCSCGPGCKNRVVQHGRKIPLELFKTANKGWGKFLMIRLLEYNQC
jgi:hypothetical protein